MDDYERTQSDLRLEEQILVEYGQALASAAESCLRYPDRLSLARSEDERDHLRREHARFLRRVLDANEVALSVLDEPTKEHHMWSKVWKVILVIGGIVGVVAQAKARGASTAEAIGEGAAALATGAGALQMNPIGKTKPQP